MLENMSSHLVSAQEEAKSCTSLEALEVSNLRYKDVQQWADK